MKQTDVIINSRKFDGTLHKSWSARLVRQDADSLELIGEFQTEIKHPILGVIRPGTVSREYYWLNRWYNVFRFHEPNGDFRNFYCNVNTPPVFVGGVLDYTDLDVDVLVRKNFVYEMLDTEEFEANARRFSYTDDLRRNVKNASDELIALIENRIFPFDYKI